MAESIKMNTVVFDRQVKEYVLITNGYERDKDGVKQPFEPCEGIAIRSWKGLTSGRIHMAWTYRKVDPAFLSPTDIKPEVITSAMNGRTSKTVEYVGRI